MSHNDLSTFAKNVKILRNALGETLEELASAAGLSGPSTISNYERGERKTPSRKDLTHLAKHFLVSPDDLLNKNLSGRANLLTQPLPDRHKSAAIFDLLPIISTPQALENPAFKKAHKIHCHFYQYISDMDNLEKSFPEDIELCLNLYQNIKGPSLFEARANLLWWFLFMGANIALTPTEVLENPDSLLKDGITLGDALHLGFLPSFENDALIEEYASAWRKRKAQFFDENGDDILSNIAILKHSPAYAALGDYYLALCYLLDYHRNTLSSETSFEIGRELLSLYAALGNPYAASFFDFFESF